MNARRTLFAALAALAISAALVQADDKPGQPGSTGAGQPGSPGAAGPGMTSLDGTWTVVSAARGGKAVEGADRMTVTIKGNVVTFSGGPGSPGGAGADKGTPGGAGADRNQLRALRLDFGPQGTIRVTEADAGGKFPGGTGTGTDRPGTGTTPPAGTGSDRPGTGAAGTMGTMSGVYVLTPDYLAISVFDAPSRPGTGTTPGGTTPETKPGTGTTPGGTGSDRPGSALGAGGTPQLNTHVSVILRRSGAGAPGAPGTPRP